MSWKRGGNPFQSTHPARGATTGMIMPLRAMAFQSTHPARGATLPVQYVLPGVGDISIHAPREGCDPMLLSRWRFPMNFNPRTPRGVRPAGRRGRGTGSSRFQSTHPARGATSKGGRRAATLKFQSTHPARGATANFTKEQGVCLAQFAYLHKGKKAEHTKTNAPMLH